MSDPLAPVKPDQFPQPQGRYLGAVSAAGLVHSAGMTPRRAGRLVVRGVVGEEVTLDMAAWAAGLAAGNALLAVSETAGGLDRIQRCARMVVYIRCAPGFTELSAVADGASAVLAARLGESALPARAAVGVCALPGGSPVEVELTAVVR